MFSEAHVQGDEGYIAKDLLAGDRERECRCQGVEKAVREGCFSIAEVLPLYEVTEPQYIVYNSLRCDC